MSTFYNYYKLLGIPIGSDLQTVIEAKNKTLETFYNKPTVASDLTELERALNEAMELFKDPLKKEAYDILLLKYYEGLVQKNQYRKYGISKANSQLQNSTNLNTEPIVENLALKLPLLKKRVLLYGAILFNLWVVSVFLFFNVYNSINSCLQAFIFLAYLVFVSKFLTSLFNYFEVRQNIRLKLKATIVTKLAVAFTFIFPFVSFSMFLKFPKWFIKENDPVTCVTYAKVYNGLINVEYTTNGKNYNRTVFEKFVRSQDEKDSNCYKGLKVQYNVSFPFIVKLVKPKE